MDRAQRIAISVARPREQRQNRNEIELATEHIPQLNRALDTWRPVTMGIGAGRRVNGWLGAGIRVSRTRVATASTAAATAATAASPTTAASTAGMISLGAVVIDGADELTGCADGREWRSFKVAEIERRLRHQQFVDFVGHEFEARQRSQGNHVARVFLRFGRSGRLLFRSRSRSRLIRRWGVRRGCGFILLRGVIRRLLLFSGLARLKTECSF